MDDDERKALLWPSWATNGLEDARYDVLDDEAKKVWRDTRGQRTDEDSFTTWAHKLSVAITQGRITHTEAVEAIRRVKHGK